METSSEMAIREPINLFIGMNMLPFDLHKHRPTGSKHGRQRRRYLLGLRGGGGGVVGRWAVGEGRWEVGGGRDSVEMWNYSTASSLVSPPWRRLEI